MTDAPDHTLTNESTFIIPMTAQVALRAIEEMHSAGEAPGFTRTDEKITGDSPLPWGLDVDGELVTHMAPGVIEIRAMDDHEGGCTVAVSLRTYLGRT